MSYEVLDLQRNVLDNTCSVSSNGTLVNNEVTLKLTNRAFFCSCISFSFWMNASEFLMKWMEFPTNGFRSPARCFASPYVGDKIQFTMGLSGMSLCGSSVCHIFWAAPCHVVTASLQCHLESLTSLGGRRYSPLFCGMDLWVIFCTAGHLLLISFCCDNLDWASPLWHFLCLLGVLCCLYHSARPWVHIFSLLLYFSFLVWHVLKCGWFPVIFLQQCLLGCVVFLVLYCWWFPSGWFWSLLFEQSQIIYLGQILQLVLVLYLWDLLRIFQQLFYLLVVYQCLNFCFCFSVGEENVRHAVPWWRCLPYPSHVVLTLLILKSMSVGVPGKPCLAPI